MCRLPSGSDLNFQNPWRQNIVATKPSSRIMIVKAAIGPNRAPQGHPFLEYVGRHRAKYFCQVHKRYMASKASSAMECQMNWKEGSGLQVLCVMSFVLLLVCIHRLPQKYIFYENYNLYVLLGPSVMKIVHTNCPTCGQAAQPNIAKSQC